MKFILLLTLLILEVGLACADDYLKYMRKVFPVDKNTVFFVDSKYGFIRLHQWEADSILVEASFKVKRAEEWEEENLAEQLGIKFEAWPGTVKVKTEISPDFERGGDLSIELTVWLPEYMVTDVVNRYGEIHIPFYNAYKHFSLSAIYGNIVVDSLRSSSDVDVLLNVAYGKLKIHNCMDVSIKSSYSETTVHKARNLFIRADKSKFYIGRADSVSIEGNYNLYEIKEKKALTVIPGEQENR